MRVEVDWTRCEGHALCEAVAPEFFAVDDEGSLTVLTEEVVASDEDRVQSAVLSCPVTALKLADH